MKQTEYLVSGYKPGDQDWRPSYQKKVLADSKKSAKQTFVNELKSQNVEVNQLQIVAKVE